jgi:hypothetical protein
MAPYFLFKDLITIFLFIIVLSILVFFMPNLLGDSENYVMANPMQTPPAIVPEWYLLPFYAILRSIPNKLLGVIAMFSAILALLVMPYADLSISRGLQFRPLSKIAFYIFVANFLILMVLGAKHVESPFIEFGQISTIIYFSYFLIIVPIVSIIENSLVDLNKNNLKNNIINFYRLVIILFIVLLVILSVFSLIMFISFIIHLVPIIKTIYIFFMFLWGGTTYLYTISADNLANLGVLINFFIKKVYEFQVFSPKILQMLVEHKNIEKLENLWKQLYNDWSLHRLDVWNLDNLDLISILHRDINEIFAVVGPRLFAWFFALVLGVPFFTFLIKKTIKIWSIKSTPKKYLLINILAHVAFVIGISQWVNRIILGLTTIFTPIIASFVFLNINMYTFNYFFHALCTVIYIVYIWYSLPVYAPHGTYKNFKVWFRLFWIFLFVSTILAFITWEGAIFDTGLPLYNKSQPYQYFIFTIASKIGAFACLFIVFFHRKSLYSTNNILNSLLEIYPGNLWIINLHILLNKHRRLKIIIVLLFYVFIVITCLNLFIIVPGQYFLQSTLGAILAYTLRA